MQTKQRRVFRTPEAAEYIGAAQSTLEKWRVTGEGPPFVRIGPRMVGYDREALERFLKARERTSTSDNGEPGNDRGLTPTAPPQSSPQGSRSQPALQRLRTGKIARRGRRGRGEALKPTEANDVT